MAKYCNGKILRFSQYWLLILAKYWHNLHWADIAGLHWHNIAHPILVKYCNSKKIEIQPILGADIGIILALCRLGRYYWIIWAQYCLPNIPPILDVDIGVILVLFALSQYCWIIVSQYCLSKITPTLISEIGIILALATLNLTTFLLILIFSPVSYFYPLLLHRQNMTTFLGSFDQFVTVTVASYPNLLLGRWRLNVTG